MDLEAGCQSVKGEQALGYVRTRYSVGDGSDIGRIGRHQLFMHALAAKAQDKLTSPGDLYSFLDELTAAEPVPARTITVQVLNGIGTPGQAAEVAGQLRAAGCTVTATGDAPAPADLTAVTYPPGLEQHAKALGARLKTPVTTEEDGDRHLPDRAAAGTDR